MEKLKSLLVERDQELAKSRWREALVEEKAASNDGLTAQLVLEVV